MIDKKPNISFFLRRKKAVYCRLRILTTSKDFSTGITISNPDGWTGRYYIDPKNKSESERVNDELESLKNRLESLVTTYRPSTAHQAIELLTKQSSKDEKLPSIPHTIREASEYYIKSSMKLKKLSIHSQKFYHRLCGNFCDFLKDEYGIEDIPLESINTKVAKGYRAYLNEKGYAGDTMQKRLAYIKGVVAMIIEDFPPDEYPEVQISFNPFRAKKIYHVKKSTKLTEYIPSRDIDRLYAYWKAQKKGSKTWEKALLALFLWNTGYSFSDVHTKPEITSDLSGNKFLLYHRHKSNVLARVIVTPEIEELIGVIDSCNFQEKYDNWLPVKCAIDEDGQFQYNSYNYQYRKFHLFCRNKLSTYMGRKITPHLFRHSFAVMMLEKGYSMSAVSKFMGHESISTTEKHYGFISDNRLITEKDKIFSSKQG